MNQNKREIYLTNRANQAIEHERNCQCKQHLKGRRLTIVEEDSLRILFMSEESFYAILQLVAHILVENPGLMESFAKNVNDISIGGSYY